MAEWELSKENIQPLKQGRKVSTLNTVLHDRDEETQKLLHEQRSAFETEIRCHAGPDPLDPWYRYISWVEQAFPKGGKEGKIHVLLEKCITRFKEDNEAKEDPRFLEVWLKYASMAINPLDVYTYMYNNGVCTQQAGLYDAWSWHLETQGNFKMAESVYLKGLDALTDEEEKLGLKQRKHQFENRVAKRMKGEEISQDEIYEQEQRKALGRLRGEGKHGKVGSVRVGGAVLSNAPGVLRSDQNAKKPLKPTNTGGIKIFQDSGSSSSSGAHAGLKHSSQENKSSRASSVPSKADHKENMMDAGKWTNAGKEKKNLNIPLNKISEMAPKPGFVVHEDEVTEESGKNPIVTPHKILPGESNVLSARKPEKEVSIPVALFEPFDQSKRPMYCKNLVYQGTTEFSFEELRAVKWRAREKKRLEEQEIEEKRIRLLEKESELREREESIAKQMEELQKMKLQHKHQQEKPPAVNVIHPSTSSNSSLSNLPSSTDSSFKKYSMDDTQKLIHSNPSGSGRTNSFTSKSITPSPHRSQGSCRPSPTVNTKAAMAVMQQLWANTTETDEVFLPDAPKFQIHCDDSERTDEIEKVCSQGSNKFEIYTDNTESLPGTSQPNVGAKIPSVPFQIFQDSSNSNAGENIEKPKFPIFCDENAEQKGFEIFSDDAGEAVKQDSHRIGSLKEGLGKSRGLIIRQDDKENGPEIREDQENVPPENYAPVKVARPRSGVLLPAQGVDWMPLEEQEKLLDEDEKRQESEPEDVFTKPLAPPAPVYSGQSGSSNVTMFVPDEAEFEKMAAKVASTPFTGKGFIPCDDDETCAVELVYNNTETVGADVVSKCSDLAGGHANQSASPLQTKNGMMGALHLSPIVEVSREHYRSSSSSSDTTQHTTRGASDKSHWGNTGLTSLHHNHRTLGLGGDNSTGLSLGVRTPGTGLGCTTTSSGYAGDKSSMYSSSHKIKDVKSQEDEDDEEDNTGMLGMLKQEFKQTINKPLTQGLKMEVSASSHQRLERSFQPSVLAEESRVLDESHAVQPTPIKLQFQGLDTTSHVTVGPKSGEISKLEGTGLNMTAAENVNLPGCQPSINITNASLAGRISPNLDATSGPPGPSLNLTKSPRMERSPKRINLDVMEKPNLEITRFEMSRLDVHRLEETTNNMSRLDMTNFDRTRPQLNLTKPSRPDSPNLDLTRPEQFSRIDSVSLNLTKPGHQLQLESPSLNLTKPGQSTRLESPSLNLTKPDDLSRLQSPNLNMTEAVLPLSPANVVDGVEPVSDGLDPFSTQFQENVLNQIKVPVDQRHGYVKCSGPLPRVKEGGMVEMGDDRFFVKCLKGEGGFAKVYSATREDTDMDCTITGIDAVLKVQSPANEWEWYICTEVQRRISNTDFSLLASSYMSIPRNYNFSNGGIFVSYHQELGTLLDVANLLKPEVNSNAVVTAAMYFAVEIMYIVEALHKIGIVHADIKPDNFLLKKIPDFSGGSKNIFEPRNFCLQLIDFGKAIDLKVLPANITFDKVVKTEGLYCTQMREKGRWREHIDYYGIAASVYCVLFGQYLDIVKTRSGVWEEKGTYKRAWRHQKIFKDFFREFINIKGEEKENLPSLKHWREKLKGSFISTMMHLYLDLNAYKSKMMK